MARVAIAFSGLVRMFDSGITRWQEIIQQYSADVYVHTWCDDHARSPVLHAAIRDKFNPVSMMISRSLQIDESPYVNNHAPYVSVYKSLSMWNSVRQANELIKRSSKTYDIIIRARMDHWVGDLALAAFPGIVIPYDTDKHSLKFKFRGMEMHGFNDCFAYGPPTHMDQYVETLDHIPALHIQDGVEYIPENLLAAHLYSCGVPLLQQQIRQFLVRS